MIINKFLTFLKKYLIFFNIFFIVILTSFYFLNPQKFDTYKIYLTYDFDERKMLNRGEPFQFVANFLSELSFSKNFKRSLSNDASKLSDKVNVQINLDINQIRFDFNYKGAIINNKTAQMKAEKILNITKTMEEAIAKYHMKLKNILTEKQNLAIGEVKNNFNTIDQDKQINPFSSFLNDMKNGDIREVEMQGNNINWVNLNNSSFSTYAPYYPNLIQTLSERGINITVFPTKIDILDQMSDDNNMNRYFTVVQEEYLNLLSNKQKIIMIKGYNEKFRRLFLNTDEYLISALIFLILFNFLVKNSSKIFK
jgi:hypothetical protein